MKILRTAVVTMLYLIAANLLVSSVVYANGGPGKTAPYAEGKQIEFVQKKDITLVSEELRVKILGDDIEVKVKYTLKNQGQAEVVDYIFPINFYQTEHTRIHSGQSDFHIYDGDKELEVIDLLEETKSIDFQKDDRLNDYIMEIETKSYVTQIPFNNGETKTVTVVYTVPSGYVDWATSNSYFPRYSEQQFLYDLTPASYWGEGVVEHFKFELDYSEIQKNGGTILKLNLPNINQSIDGLYTFERSNYNLNDQSYIHLVYDQSPLKNTNFIKSRIVSTKKIAKVSASSTLQEEGYHYGIENLLDGHLNTAWVEGEDGLGIGETFEIEFKNDVRIGAIGLINGYASHNTTYENNAKVKKIKIEYTFSDDQSYMNEVNVSLEDRTFKPHYNMYSPSMEVLDDFGDSGPLVRKVKFTILDAYPGLKYEDTAISELLILEHNHYPEYSFLDVSNKDWFYDEVSQLAWEKIISGYPDKTFKPRDTINIDAFIKMVISALGYSVEKGDSDWATPYIVKALELGIIKQDEFQDYQSPISRGEMARIVIRALGTSEPNEPEFISNIPDWQSIPTSIRKYVLAAYQKGIIVGYADGSFGHLNKATRAEASIVIMRMLYKDERKEI